MSNSSNNLQFFTLDNVQLAVNSNFVVKSEKLDSKYIGDVSFNPIVGIVSHFGLNAPLIDIRFEYDLDPISYTESTSVLIINYKGTVLGIIVDTISDTLISDIYQTIDITEIIKNDPYLLQDGFEEEEAIIAIEEAIKIAENHHITDYNKEKISLNVIDNSNNIANLVSLKNKCSKNNNESKFSKLYIGELLEEALSRDISITKDMNRDDIITALDNSIS